VRHSLFSYYQSLRQHGAAHPAARIIAPNPLHDSQTNSVQVKIFHWRAGEIFQKVAAAVLPPSLQPLYDLPVTNAKCRSEPRYVEKTPTM